MMKVAVVGATGLVGQTLIDVLEKRDFPVSEFIPVASARSVGKKVEYGGQSYTLVSMEDAIEMAPDVALFSAGGSVSTEYAPKFAERGTCVIDNSSAWRMDDRYLLVVPEVNGHLLTGEERIIANPNCSTIQLVTALKEVHQELDIQRLVISTYQSITGTGQKAVDQYEAERQGKTAANAPYPHKIFGNCLPHCDVFLDNDYTKEEMKLVHETRKILGDDSIRITATAVRVPVWGGHSESVNVEVGKPFDIEELKNVFRRTEGVIVEDDIRNNVYPMPLNAFEKDEVFVGRIRKDESQKNTFNCWIVADNLRKGAATNAVQIAEKILELRSGKRKND